MKRTTTIIGLCILGMVAFVSCSKSSSSSSSSNSLVGTWKITKEADDDNNNGKMETSEEYAPDSITALNSYVFNTNGTAVFSGPGFVPTTHLTWTLIKNNTYLQLAVTDSGSTWTGQPGYIESISSSTMILRDSCGTCSPVYSWTILTKQ